MPGWRRLIVGDASSRSFDYYRDLVLMWPFLVFSIISIIQLLSPEFAAYRPYGLQLAACAIVAILLAKEKLMLFGGALAFVTLRLAVVLVFRWNSVGFLVLLVAGGILFAILRLRWDWRPSHESPNKMDFYGWLVSMTSLGLSIALLVWMRP